MKQKIFQIIISILLVIVLALSLRGNLGNPNALELQGSKWRGGGVFEVSPERGRFGLLYSLIEDKSFYFSVDVARFIVPDLGYKNGHYVSLFAPAVSFITAPGYIIGRLFGASQVGTFAIISLFALANFYLITRISETLGATKRASILGGLIFLLATPAFAYAVNLYQHHISTFLILLATFIVIRSKKIWHLFFVWFLCAMSIPVDYPNLILMFPIGIYALFKIIKIKKGNKDFKININFFGLLTFLGLILPLIFFLWFNFKSYDNPLQFSGTVGGVHEIDEKGFPTVPKDNLEKDKEDYISPDKQKKTAVGFFKTRNILNGFYIHILSPDRGILIFAPVLLTGLVGIYLMNKNKNKYLPMLLGIVVANIILYSMWGDPWGGWSFGSRYLIPAYAIMSIFIALAITLIKNKKVFLLFLTPLLIYSVAVNTLGAITTSANPPQVESNLLSTLSGQKERYSIDRNWNYLTNIGSKSFVYQTWAKDYFSARDYYFLVLMLITILFGLSAFYYEKDRNKNSN